MDRDRDARVLRRRAEPPQKRRAAVLRPDDVEENPALRGRVIRAGVGAVPAVWED